MNQSFYVGALGAGNCTEKLSVISNNLANVNTNGFKPKTTVFSQLINYNLNDSEGAVTELQAGAGMKVQSTYTGFDTSGLTQTGSPMRSLWCRTRPQGLSVIRGTDISTGRSGKMDSIS